MQNIQKTPTTQQQKATTRDFPGDPVAKNPPAHAGRTGSIPGLGPVGHSY